MEGGGVTEGGGELLLGERTGVGVEEDCVCAGKGSSLLSKFSTFCAGLSFFGSSCITEEVKGDGSLSPSVFLASLSDTSSCEEDTGLEGLNLCSQLPDRLLPPLPASSPPLLSPPPDSLATGTFADEVLTNSVFSLLFCASSFGSREARRFSIVSSGAVPVFSSVVIDFPNRRFRFSEFLMLPLRRLSNELVRASLARSSFESRGGLSVWW